MQLVQDLLSRSLGNITASIALCTRVSQMLDQGALARPEFQPPRRTA